MTIAGQIQETLYSQSPPDAASSIQEIVAKQINLIDPELKIERTGYFNHRAMPDLIASWNDKRASDRQIFLRFKATDPHLAQDLDRLTSNRSMQDPSAPMVCTFDDFDVEQVPEVTTAAVHDCEDLMVTGVEALSQLGSSRRESFESVVSSTMVKAGRGLFDSNSARDMQDSMQNALTNALAGDLQGTTRAVDTAKQRLAEEASHEISRYLRVLWIAGGHASDDYPDSELPGLNLLGEIPDAAGVATVSSEDLAALVTLVLRRDLDLSAENWRQLGRLLDMEAVCSLEEPMSFSGFQAMMNALSENLHAAMATVQQRQDDQDSVQKEPIWAVREGQLRFEGAFWQIRFFPQRKEHRRLQEDGRLPSFSSLRRNAMDFHVDSFDFDHEDIAVSVKQRVSAEAGANALVSARSLGLDESSLVRRLVLDGKPKILVEFDRCAAVAERDPASLARLRQAAEIFLVPQIKVDAADGDTLFE